MRLAAGDDAFLGVANIRRANVSVGNRLAALVRQRVHQPRLPLGLFPDGLLRLGGELLARFLPVLFQQAIDVALAEVAEPQRLGANVEGAAAGDDFVRRARADAVVAHVAHAAQYDALRELARAAIVARPQLAQHGEQRVADQRIDFVYEQHERLGGGPRPFGEHLRQRAEGAGFSQDARPRRVGKGGTFRPRPRRQLAQHRPHGLFGIFPRRLAGLEVGVDALAVALAIQPRLERQQGGGLARLPWRTQHEIPPLLHEHVNLAQIHALQRWHAVVPIGFYRPGGVEEAHGGSVADRAAPLAYAS